MAGSKDDDGLSGVGDPGGGNPMLLGDGTSRTAAKTASNIGTPMQTNATTRFFDASGSYSGRLTRSMTRDHFEVIPDPTFSGMTRLQEKLRNASSKNASQSSVSKLEDSNAIRYEDDGYGDDDEDEKQDEEEEEEEVDGEELKGKAVLRPSTRLKLASETGRPPPIGQARALSRQPARIRDLVPATRDSSPLAAASSVTNDGQRPRKKRRLAKGPTRLPTRRSPRLAKPLTEFHKYPDLPPELQLMIWEAAINPRLAYIRNRASTMLAPTSLIQNKRPTWFMTCKMSLHVAMNNYRKMFARHSPVDTATRQDINPNTDIVLFEPCCSGCRAYHCARHQLSSDDRNSIRSLAVQIESPWLIPTAPPCWSTIAEAWSQVDTVYLLKTAVRGNDLREKAMIRIEEGEYEKSLRKKFDDWKKGEGKDKVVSTLEFVTVVEQEPETKLLKDRYKSVGDRKTGQPEDVIIG